MELYCRNWLIEACQVHKQMEKEAERDLQVSLINIRWSGVCNDCCFYCCKYCTLIIKGNVN